MLGIQNQGFLNQVPTLRFTCQGATVPAEAQMNTATRAWDTVDDTNPA